MDFQTQRPGGEHVRGVKDPVNVLDRKNRAGDEFVQPLNHRTRVESHRLDDLVPGYVTEDGAVAAHHVPVEAGVSGNRRRRIEGAPGREHNLDALGANRGDGVDDAGLHLSEVDGEGVVDVQGDQLWGPVDGQAGIYVGNAHRTDRPPR